MVGQAEVKVTYIITTSVSNQLTLVVVNGKGPSLLGRNWLKHLQMDWSVFSVSEPTSHSQLVQLLEEHAEVFSPTPGCLQGVAVKLHTRQDAIPKFCRARQPPYALGLYETVSRRS